MSIDMKKYGLSEYYIEKASEFEDLTVARVISQEKGLYKIVAEYGEKLAEISGKFHYNVKSASDYPAVGDFVMVDWVDDNSNAVIHTVLDRKSCFVRKAAGNAKQEQIVAANIDIAFLCMSLNNDFNLRRLERYLSIAWESGATPVIVLTKSDLCKDLDSKLIEVYEIANSVEVSVTSSLEKLGYEYILKFIEEGKTVAFIGSSGVGKSTLINRLLGEERLETNGLRNDDKGRHTTTHRELLLLPNGGIVIDTPGMREFGMWENSESIDKVFEDIEALTYECKFSNCTHNNEPGCAIQRALNSGELSLERWNSYKKLKLESSYLDDKEGYLEIKEQKFKNIAKINKKRRR